MKKILITLSVLMLVSSFCFAQQPTTPKTQVEIPKAPAVKILVGEVKSVTMADTTKGTKPEIVVVGKSGAEPKEYTLLVSPTTTIYDSDGKAITLDKIVQGARVKVNYTITSKSVNEAISIRLMKQLVK